MQDEGDKFKTIPYGVTAHKEHTKKKSMQTGTGNGILKHDIHNLTKVEHICRPVTTIEISWSMLLIKHRLDWSSTNKVVNKY